MHTRDGHIVHQCLSGSAEAFALLVDKYKERIFALVYAKVGQFQDAEDLTQDVFLEAYKNLSTLRRWDNFYPWLYSIASNQCKNFHRAQKRQVVTAHLAEQNENHRMNMDAHSERLRNERVQDALASLPEMHRQVLVLRYMAGMKSKEIAETLRVSPNTINQRLMRARAKLKAVFNEEMIQMMHTTIAERKLQPGFSAHVVELISDAKIQTAPHKTALPLGLSAAGGIILLLLSLSLPHSPLYPLGEWLGGYLPLKTQVVEDGELPVDSDATRVAILGAEREDVDFGRRPKLPMMSATIGYLDYQTWGLPESAIARLGKGNISQGDRVIAFSPDGEHLAVTTTIGVWLYDVKTTRELALFAGGRSGWMHAVAFSPDGTLLAAGDAGDIKLWEVATRRNIATLGGHMGWVWSVAFSPDGTKLASASNDTTVKLWEVATGKNTATLTGHTDHVESVAFSPDGTKLVSGSMDKTIKLWEVATGKNTATLTGHTDHVESVAFSPDGTKLASGSSDKTVRLWEVATGKNIATLGHTNSASDVPQVLRSIVRSVLKSTAHTTSVLSVMFSPDGTKLVSGSLDGTVILWEVSTGKNLATLEGTMGGLHKSVAFSPDGTLIAHTSGLAGTVEIWAVSTENNINTIFEHTDSVHSAAFSPDGTKLAAALSVSQGVKLWEIKTGKNIATFAEGMGSVISVAFSPDGAKLACTPGALGRVKLWEVETRKEIATFQKHTGWVSSVVFSPDGAKLASGADDKTVKLWEVATGKNIATLIGHTKLVASVAFSPDGTKLASGSEDKMVKLWEVATGKNVATLAGHMDRVSSVAFSPDSKKLASGS